MTEQLIRTQLRLPVILYEAVREYAHIGRKSRNQFINEAIQEKVERLGNGSASRAEMS